MTRDASASHPFDLFMPEPEPGQPVDAMVDGYPDDERILEILSDGPLLPFDYCYLRGQREGLVPVVQTQLVQRNRRLVRVDRTPLGIDPNADLFRCFLMHGNPNEPVTVYTFYERDVCSGVVATYFQVPEIKRHLYMHYSRKGWLDGNAITQNAKVWLDAYDEALRWLYGRVMAWYEQPAGKAGGMPGRSRAQPASDPEEEAAPKVVPLVNPRARAELASEWAQWIHPILRCLDRDSGVRATSDEARVLASTEQTQLARPRLAFWELVGDFTFLSIVSRPAFCAFAWMKQVQFPHLTRLDSELSGTGRRGIFRPKHLVTGLVALFVGLLIIGFFGAGTALLPAIAFGGIPAVGGLVLVLANLCYWLMYTSGSPGLARRVPVPWTRGKPKNVGYLR